MELQQAWDLIAEQIVENSDNPNNPHICLFVRRTYNHNDRTFEVVVTNAEDEVFFKSKKFEWITK